MTAAVAASTYKPSIGIAIGAVRLNRRYAQDFLVLLETLLEEKVRYRGVDGKKEEILTLHLPPVAAASLDDGREELTRFLEERGGVYMPGVRRACPTLAVPSLRSVEDGDGSESFRFAELFAGIGGFRLGLEHPSVGGKCVLSNELDSYAANFYRQNFDLGEPDGARLVEGDLLDIASENLPDFDMLVGGFPCQPFSARGDQKGLEDDRGQLYREMGRILTDRRPKCFIFENVTGLVTIGGGLRTGRVKGQRPTFTPGVVFERILDTFRSCGYKVDWQVVNSRKWLPQMRERVYIVGTRDDLPGPGCDAFNWDALLLKELGDEDASTVRQIMESKDSPHVAASALTPSQLDKVHSMMKKKKTVLAEGGRIDPDKKAPTLISSYRTPGSVSTKYLLEEADGTPCRPRPRFLTPRECTRLMGFPEAFVVPPPDEVVAVAKYYQAIGNAVCPPVISALGTELMNCVR